jgi:hypothetical protein
VHRVRAVCPITIFFSKRVSISISRDSIELDLVKR